MNNWRLIIKNSKLTYLQITLDCTLVYHFLDPGGGENRGTLICAGCLNAIEDEFIEALNQEWHIDCFR